MKINNPNQIHKQKHPKWTKINHYDNDYYILTRYSNINRTEKLFGVRMELQNGSMIIGQDMEIKEIHQPRTPANAPHVRMEHFKIANYEG